MTAGTLRDESSKFALALIDHDQGIVHFKGIDDFGKRFGLNLIQVKIIENQQFLFLQFAAESHFKGQFLGFFRHLLGIGTIVGPENNTATSEQRRFGVAAARPAGSFLTEEFSTTASHIRTVFDRRGSRTSSCQLRVDDLVQNAGLNRYVENGIESNRPAIFFRLKY